MMYADISLQQIKLISAQAFTELRSVPFMLKFYATGNGDFSHGQICLHLEDAKLATDLVEAINDVLAKHAAAPSVSVLRLVNIPVA